MKAVRTRVIVLLRIPLARRRALAERIGVETEFCVGTFVTDSATMIMKGEMKRTPTLNGEYSVL